LFAQLFAVTLLAFVLVQAAWAGPKLTVLHNFGAPGDGSGPFGPLALDGKGNLYGVTAIGGTGTCGDYGCGTVFELSPGANGTWGETILHNFAAGNDGALPWGSLVFDSARNLYGTLVGDNGLGGSGVFRLSHGPTGWGNALIYDDGAGRGLLVGRFGDLYGDIGPGQNEEGAIGELSPGPDGWNYTQLYSYCGQVGCPDDDGMPAPPIWDGKGNLWGTTTDGGTKAQNCTFGCGVIFAMTPNGDGTWTYHVAHRFAASAYDGQLPYGSLVMDAAGNFYGSTWLGGPYGHGTIFKFAHTDGQWMVEGTLALDSVGNLYGTAAGGTGSCAGFACGVVFRLAPQKNGSWKYNVIYELNETTGGVQPFYGVILDGKGNLFGVTSSSGTYGSGTAFEISP
jgi:uncharacterized repeat protein (TIGR03803 family)